MDSTTALAHRGGSEGLYDDDEGLNPPSKGPIKGTASPAPGFKILGFLFTIVSYFFSL